MEPQEQPLTLDAITINANDMITGLMDFIRDSRRNLIFMGQEIERLKVFETNAPKLKAEIIELKGKLKLLKKGKK